MPKAREGGEPPELPSAVPGTVLGQKYRLERIIGTGGMGSVWAGTHLGLGQPVAVKLIAREHASSRENLVRFDLEAKAAARLRSRFVVQVYDNGVTPDGLPYIVMELLEGESLAQRIKRHGPIASEESLRLLSQVARALSRAHGLGIVHRDLKPDNVFLTLSPDEDGEIAKILDFGIAKVRAPQGPATITGAVLGTPLYMSPEQARGLRSVDHRTDVYSLGMLAFAMMTGKEPFQAASVGELLLAICTQPLPSMHGSAPWLPMALDAWLARTCAREPSQRYGSIDEALASLYTALGKRPSVWPAGGRHDRSSDEPIAPPPHSATQDLGLGRGAVAILPTPAGFTVPARPPKTSMWPVAIAVAVSLALMAVVVKVLVLPMFAKAERDAVSPVVSSGTPLSPESEPNRAPTAESRLPEGQSQLRAAPGEPLSLPSPPAAAASRAQPLSEPAMVARPAALESKGRTRSVAKGVRPAPTGMPNAAAPNAVDVENKEPRDQLGF